MPHAQTCPPASLQHALRDHPGAQHPAPCTCAAHSSCTCLLCVLLYTSALARLSASPSLVLPACLPACLLAPPACSLHSSRCFPLCSFLLPACVQSVHGGRGSDGGAGAGARHAVGARLLPQRPVVRSLGQHHRGRQVGERCQVAAAFENWEAWCFRHMHKPILWIADCCAMKCCTEGTLKLDRRLAGAERCSEVSWTAIRHTDRARCPPLSLSFPSL